MKGLIEKFPPDAHLQALKAAKDQAKQRLQEYKEQLQADCEHKEVFECKHQSMTFFSDMPPRRQCANCLLEEDGWGCGYKILGRAEVVVPIGREDLYGRRV